MMRAIAVCLVAVPLVACGPSRAVLKDQIKQLESEMLRIRSERVNLDARAKSLDDQLFIVKKRLDKCQRDEEIAKPKLKVVRLMADPEESEYEGGDESGDDASDDEQDVGRRPRLVLSATSPRTPAPRQGAAPANGPRLIDPEAFHGLGADDLGVAQPDPDVDAGDPAMAVFNSAYRAYANKQYQAALLGFSDFVKAFPNHHYADNALFWRGECYLASGQMLRAIGEFERLASRYPQSDKVPSGIYRIGFVYDKLRDVKKAVEYYYRVVERFPGTDAARRASRRVSEIEERTGGQSGIVPTAIKR